MKYTNQTTTKFFSVAALCAAAALMLALGCEKPQETSGPANAPQPPQEAAKSKAPTAPQGEAASAGMDKPEPESGGSAAEQPTPKPPKAQAKLKQKAPEPQGEAGAAKGQPPAGAAPTEISDEKVDRYIEVRPEIQNVQKELQQKMQQASDREEANAMQQQARKDIKAQLGKAGLTPKDYVAIEMALQKDPELRKRVQSAAN